MLLGDLFLFSFLIIFYSVTVRVRYCISSHTHFFLHTINISNDPGYYWKKNGGKRTGEVVFMYRDLYHVFYFIFSFL